MFTAFLVNPGRKKRIKKKSAKKAGKRRAKKRSTTSSSTAAPKKRRKKAAKKTTGKRRSSKKRSASSSTAAPKKRRKKSAKKAGKRRAKKRSTTSSSTAAPKKRRKKAAKRKTGRRIKDSAFLKREAAQLRREGLRAKKAGRTAEWRELMDVANSLERDAQLERARGNPRRKRGTSAPATPMGAVQEAAKILQANAKIEADLAERTAEAASLREKLSRCEAGSAKASQYAEEISDCLEAFDKAGAANAKLKAKLRAVAKDGRVTKAELASLEKTIDAKNKQIAALKKQAKADLTLARRPSRAAAKAVRGGKKRRGKKRASAAAPRRKKAAARRRVGLEPLGGRRLSAKFVGPRKAAGGKKCKTPKANSPVKCRPRPSQASLAACARAAKSWQSDKRGFDKKKRSARAVCGPGVPRIKAAAYLGGKARHAPKGKSGKPMVTTPEQRKILAQYAKLGGK